LATQFFDLSDKFVGGQSLEPQVCAASTNALLGTAIDMLAADGPVFAYLTLGTVTDAGGTADIDVKIQECATSTGTFTDFSVGGSFTQSYNQTTGDLVSEWITSQHRQYRWVRAHASVTGTTLSVPIHVSVLSMKKTLGNSGTYTSNP
jgi:hypothetical protein